MEGAALRAPALPQVYVLAVMSAVMRASEQNGEPPAELVFLVPPYDPTQVFLPSYAHKAAAKGALGARHGPPPYHALESKAFLPCDIQRRPGGQA